MSQRITVTVTCDEKVSPECSGTYEESAPQLSELEYIGMRMFQQEWHRGYKLPEGEDGQPYVDICGPCWAMIQAGQQAKSPEEAAQRPT